MQFLDFERQIAELYERIEKVKEIGNTEGVDINKTLEELQKKLAEVKKQVYSNLTPWQRVQLSRHPERPYTLYYIAEMCTAFTELHGDRLIGDDKAIVGGFGTMAGQTVMFVGHQKGVDTKSRQYRNFGMANPEGYRKALRLMKLAEKFNKPIVCLIDTPGAFPGIEAEERGQAEAIARNLYEMSKLKVPVVCVIIGEGASGGALGIGVGDRILMLENTWYSVISPESCSSILWRSWEHKEKAAEQLHLTASDMYFFKLVDEIVEEPLGGAHKDPQKMAQLLKDRLIANINQLQQINPAERIAQRITKFTAMGKFEEV
ncbi:acetyl-CoA carboxylase carboxyltransferase subunit alpha [Sphingobacteriales bacterium UPWRP_1]|nr:acetyl-CoA carboxylase carboxyl transferase subunit alpha [Sphingobacteriales bacterium TSM_CSS]PSJ77631.1 acetyl-CoA carboxylase carboxyltransferase subunit alpha [Sphingobacteriales bacterium UPWRP_1]